METSTQILIRNIYDAWKQYLSRANALFAELPNARFNHEVSPGRNSGIYLLGHLAAVNDNLIPLLGLGKARHPEWVDLFLRNPDKSGLEKPEVSTLLSYWQEVNQTLLESMDQFTESDWLAKHNSISEEDFKKNPHRNRLNVIINRTNHLAYHLGQLAFLK